MMHEAPATGRVKFPNSGPHQKIKVDRQIVAIAKQRGCSAIYSNDRDIKNLADEANIAVIGIERLPLPPSPPRPPLLEYLEDQREAPP